MTDFMLTVVGNNGARDVRVNNELNILDAIEVAEKATGCRVDHGRSGVLDRFDPAIICEGGKVYHMHDRTAQESMTVHQPGQRVSVAKGEGKK